MLNLDFASEKEEHTSIDFDYALKQVQRSSNRQLIQPKTRDRECGINLSLGQQSGKGKISFRKKNSRELSEEISYIKQPVVKATNRDHVRFSASSTFWGAFLEASLPYLCDLTYLVQNQWSLASKKAVSCVIIN